MNEPKFTHQDKFNKADAENKLLTAIKNVTDMYLSDEANDYVVFASEQSEEDEEKEAPDDFNEVTEDHIYHHLLYLKSLLPEDMQ